MNDDDDPITFVTNLLTHLDARLIDKHYMTIALDRGLTVWVEVIKDGDIRGLIETRNFMAFARSCNRDRTKPFKRGVLNDAFACWADYAQRDHIIRSFDDVMRRWSA